MLTKYKKIQYTNFNDFKKNIKPITDNISNVFFSVIDVVKQENPKKYEFIYEDFKNTEEDCNKIQTKLVTLLNDSKNNFNILSNNEALLYKILLCIFYCQKLCGDIFIYMPKYFITNNSLCNSYCNCLIKQFINDLSPYFKLD